jgi:hypothetical protein
VRGISLNGALKPEALYTSLKLSITVSSDGWRPAEPSVSALAGEMDYTSLDVDSGFLDRFFPGLMIGWHCSG